MAKPKQLTQPQRRELGKLHARLAAAQQRIWDAAPDRNTVWSKCCTMAKPAELDLLRLAVDELNMFEARMIDEWRAWRDDRGHVQYYGFGFYYRGEATSRSATTTNSLT